MRDSPRSHPCPGHLGGCRPPWRRVRWVAVVALSAVLLAPAGAAAQHSPDTLSVLFIGNSLTIENDLPAMVRALLESAGINVRVASLAQPGYGLEDHWRLGVARKMIAGGGWDVVVLQQGPSATEGRPSLLEYSARFAEDIEAAGGQAALYMVWPARHRFFDFDGVRKSYAMAADSANGLLLPVGDAWRAAWRLDPDVALYGPDGFHPGPAATYLAALVICQRLAGLDPRALPAVLNPTAPQESIVPRALQATLQEAAAAANAELQP